MRTVILRDDDTNALTPPGCLERLYRPFLDRGLPVNLAVIPEVRADARCPDGRIEGFLSAWPRSLAATVRLEESPALIEYLRADAGYHIAQHGCHHDYFEFDQLNAAAATVLVDRGAERLREAGFSAVSAFVAPHDRISRASLPVIARRFPVISTGWFELERMPRAWLADYLREKIQRAPHWRRQQTTLLSHPGCLLSRTRPTSTMFAAVRRQIEAQRLTVLVTHWWEYFPYGLPDAAFIGVLHELADYLERSRDIQVVSFQQVAAGAVPLR
jgi:hypothetical protein